MATTIHFTYPVFTILGCVIFLHEKIKKMKVLAVALSFSGILFFYNPDGSVSLPGMALAFVSGMTYAFYTIYLRESSLKDMDSVKLIFYLNTAGAVMMLIMALAAGDFTVGLTPAAWADADIHKLCFARDEPETAIACDKPVLFGHKVEAVLILHEVMMHCFPAPRIGKAEAANIINGRHILFLCFADQDFPCSFSHKTSASLRRM